MGFFDKPKTPNETPIYEPQITKQVVEGAPNKLATQPEQKTAPATTKVTINPPTKQVATTPNYGYGPEEADFDVYNQCNDFAFPKEQIVKPAPYKPSTTMSKSKEKPEPWYKTYKPKPLYEKRSVIIMVVEASEDALMYKAEILKLIKKIVTDNQDELFMFIRFGNDTMYSPLTPGIIIKHMDVTTDLFELREDAENTFDIYDVFKHIYSFIRDHSALYETLCVDTKQYALEDVRIIFIGTGKADESIHNPKILLRTLCKNSKVKAVKYFCLKDEHTIKAAAIGFPVIGHIESNFYK